jgi:uncharacterized protein YuzE
LENGLKMTYDREVDILRILFNDAPIKESNEQKPGLILDYDKDGNVVGLKPLHASERIQEPDSLQFALASANPVSVREKPGKQCGKSAGNQSSQISAVSVRLSVSALCICRELRQLD